MNGAVFRARGLPIEEGVGNSWDGVSGRGGQRSILVRVAGVAHHFVTCAKEPVGAGLLAKASIQLALIGLMHRFREQARSHSGMVLNLIFGSTQNPVGAGLLAKASIQLALIGIDAPLSRAGSLPQWNGVELDIRFDTKPCGSELAREGVGSACIKAMRYPLAPGAISLVSR